MLVVLLGVTRGRTKTLTRSVSSVCSKRGLDPKLNRFCAPIVYHEHYSFDHWPEQHTFPMDKFSKIAHALTNTCKKTLPDQSTLSRPLVRSYKDFFRPLDVEDVPVKDWFEIIDHDFLHRFLNGQLSEQECRYIGFREQTGRPELIRRTILEVAGTILACELALAYQVAANVAGGTHHARPDGGAGYTILNDLAVATHYLTKYHSHIQRVLVVDCDVHQGDGTALFGRTVLKERLFTLSLHCQSNYPQLKQHSTFDVGLPDKMEDEAYLTILKQSVEAAISNVRPDFVIYDAGVDVFKEDRLGRLHLSEHGIRQRDRYVLDTCVSKGIPVAAVVGGGYDKDVDRLARRHAIVHEECAFVWRKHQLWNDVIPSILF